MNRAFLKHPLLLLLIILVLLICLGCKQEKNIIGEGFTFGGSFSAEQSSPVAVRYKSGAILVKNNEEYNMTNQKNFTNPGSNIGEIKFGPKNINFAN